jgi:hypothetical protein
LWPNQGRSDGCGILYMLQRYAWIQDFGGETWREKNAIWKT